MSSVVRSLRVPASQRLLTLGSRRSSTLGVVRIVNAPTEVESGNVSPSFDNVGGPLLNRASPTKGAVDRVTVELRAADLFRRFKNNPDKATILSVVDGLHALELEGKLLNRFPVSSSYPTH